MTRPIDLARLGALVEFHGLASVLGTPQGLESTARRLDAFFASYGQHRRGPGAASTLPREQDWDAVLQQSQTNPHRVQVLLQAIAFVCSSEMLAMLWMVQLGASVKALHVDHERENATTLRDRKSVV